MDSQSPSAGARPITHTTTPPARKLPDIHLDIVLVVFCGGAIGTAIRYAFAQIPRLAASIPARLWPTCWLASAMQG